METRASYLLVGAFVLALMAGAVVFIIWVTGGETTETETYYMRFSSSVTGLQIGSQVRFRGIPVGEVTDIEIVETEDDPTAPILIEVTAEVKASTPIRTNTRATLEIQGITGASFIQLTSENVPGPAPRLTRTAKNEKLYIETRPSAIEKVFQSFPELLTQLTELATQGTKLLSNENLQHITQSLASLDQIAREMAENKDLKVLISQAREVLETTGPAIKNIGDAAEGMNGAAREIETLIRNNQQPIADFTASGLYELTTFLVEARDLVASLQRLTKRVEDDPARFLFGDQQQGYQPR